MQNEHDKQVPCRRVNRDFSFIIDHSLNVEVIISIIKNTNKTLIKKEKILKLTK